MSNKNFFEVDQILVDGYIANTLTQVHEGQYDALIPQAAKMMNSGRFGGFFVPAVVLALDAVLNAVSDPQTFREPIGTEVLRRELVAHALSDVMIPRLLGLHKIGTALFIDPEADRVNTPILALYGRTDDLAMQLAAHNVNTSPAELMRRSNEQLTSLVTSPFHDARLVMGGAVTFLRQQSRDVYPAEVVGSSPGLQAVAGIERNNVDVVAALLGNPYYSPDSYEVTSRYEALSLGLTSYAANIVAHYSEGAVGCPANQFRLPQSDHSVLSENWQRIANYLLPEGATTHEQVLSDV